MKKKILTGAICLLMGASAIYGYGYAAYEQITLTETGGSPDKYCAKLRDGRLIVLHQGQEVTAEVTLENGTVIKPDGTVIKKDGTRVVLRDGECVSVEGEINKERARTRSKEKRGKEE